MRSQCTRKVTSWTEESSTIARPHSLRLPREEQWELAPTQMVPRPASTVTILTATDATGPMVGTGTDLTTVDQRGSGSEDHRPLARLPETKVIIGIEGLGDVVCLDLEVVPKLTLTYQPTSGMMERLDEETTVPPETIALEMIVPGMNADVAIAGRTVGMTETAEP